MNTAMFVSFFDIKHECTFTEGFPSVVLLADGALTSYVVSVFEWHS